MRTDVAVGPLSWHDNPEDTSPAESHDEEGPMGVRISQVDAFTDRPFAGNPAAVCVLRNPPTKRGCKPWRAR